MSNLHSQTGHHRDTELKVQCFSYLPDRTSQTGHHRDTELKVQCFSYLPALERISEADVMILFKTDSYLICESLLMLHFSSCFGVFGGWGVRLDLNCFEVQIMLSINSPMTLKRESVCVKQCFAVCILWQVCVHLCVTESYVYVTLCVCGV